MARHVVVLATMTFKVGGKQVTQSGAVFTVALRSSRKGGASRLGHGRKALLGSDMLEFDDIQHILLTAAWGRSKGTLEKQGK